MRVLMIAQYVAFPFEGGNNRFCYLLDLLKKAKGNRIELLTSSFRHGTKAKHTPTKKDIEKLGCKVTFIDEPGYKKNISLRRIFSTKILAKNTKKYLNQLEETPDVIYCAVPSLDIAKVAAKYAKKHDIRFIIDIQDLWPEAFQMVFNPPVFGNLLYLPFKIAANRVYKNADEICAVSKTYADRALMVNKKCKNAHIVFLGTDLDTFDKNAKQHYSHRLQKKPNEIWVAYCGTLGSSYDLETAIKAIAKTKNNNLQLIVMGDGPLRERFTKLAKANNIKATFTGRIPYERMCSLLADCDITINPIMRNAAQSVINKHADYVASGLPIISTQENQEFRNLIDEYEIGFNCNNGDIADMASKISRLATDRQLRGKLGKNARRLAEIKFNRAKTYQELATTITRKV